MGRFSLVLLDVNNKRTYVDQLVMCVQFDFWKQLKRLQAADTKFRIC